MVSARQAAVCLALLGAGCGLSPQAHRSGFALPREDAEFASALACFSEGILLEAESGQPSPAALAAFERAARLDPRSAMLRNLVARSLLQQGRVDEALAELEDAFRREPDAATGADIARLAEAAQRYALAARYYAALSRLQPDEIAWQHGQVRTLFLAGDTRHALTVLEALSRGADDRLDPAPSFAWGLELLRREPPHAAAPATLRLALRGASNDLQRAQVLDALALGELRLGNTNAAARAFRDAVDLLPGDPAPVMRLAQFDQLVWGDAATSRWEQALARDPSDLTTLLALTGFYADARQPARAAAFARRALPAYAARHARRPPPAAFYTSLAAILDEAGDDEGAETLLTSGQRAHPQSPALQNHLAYLWIDRNRRLDEAEPLILNALRQQPQNGAFLDTLGWLRFRQQRFDEALDLLARALQSLDEEDGVVLDHLGDTLAALQRPHDAQAAWLRGYAIDPQTPGLADKLRARGLLPAAPP